MAWIWSSTENGLGSCTTADEATEGIDASGRTAIVTGGAKGIGEYTARTLARRGVHVVIGVRNLREGLGARERILADLPDAKVDVMELDLASFASVRSFASKFLEKSLPLNILINNAAVFMTPFMLSKDGYELQFAINHLGHFLLTNLLLDKLRETASSSGIEGRIINVSSTSHYWSYKGGIRWTALNEQSGYDTWKAYGQSKLANIYHTNELAKRLKEEGSNVTANSLHPGTIRTNLFRNSRLLEGGIGILSAIHVVKSIPQGAATSCYVAVSPRVTGTSGKFFNNCNVAQPSKQAMSAENQIRLWDLSLEFTSQ